jgi:hypothetical protein
MKKYLLLLITSISVVLQAWQIDSSYKIVIPKQSYDGSTQRYLLESAKYLQFVFRSLGKELPIISSKEPIPGKKSIFIGFKDHNKYQYFSGSIRFDNYDIHITGNDVHAKKLKGKNNSFRSYYLGTVKALTSFMERYLNVRFVMPGKYGTAILPGSLPQLPVKAEIFITPQLIFATGCWTDMFYEYANNCYGRGNVHSYGGHSWYKAVPPSKYAKTNPEYYAVLQGRRAPDFHFWSLCISNKNVEELIYKEVLKQIDSGAQTVELAQTDGYRECECSNCKNLYNTNDPAEKLWIFHTKIAKRLLKDRPGKNVMIPAYSPTFAPPKTFSKFPPNVIIELTRYDEEYFQKWQKVEVPGGFFTYIYNWGEYQTNGITPKFSSKQAVEQVKRFMKYNVKGVYRCGFGTLYGLEGFVYYLYGKLFDNVNLDIEQARKEYCLAAFGKEATPFMVSFFSLIDDAIDQYPTSFHGTISPVAKKPETLLACMWTSQRLNQMEKQLSLAEKAPKNNLEAQRLAITRFQFNYLKNLMQIQFAYQAYQLTYSKDILKVILDLLDKRADIEKQSFKGNKQLTFPNFPHIYHLGVPAKFFKSNGSLNAILTAPYTWNTKAIRAKNILPGISTKRLIVKKINQKVDTNFTNGPWKNIPWEYLSEIQLNQLKTQSRFKVAYDNDNFYLGMESDLSDNKTFIPLGKDGKCWQFDCIEMVLDPWGTREKYFHFITNPIGNSLYEAAVGLIEDPLHPLYKGMDPSWNGKWSYVSTRKNNKWNILFVIPFSTLGKKAKSNDIWCFNVCREAFIEKNNTKPELSCWSPCFEAHSFHEKSTFGELFFQ